jgi:hypothetical protein
MRIAKGHMVALGYGKYFRSDSIVGLEPIEEGRGPGKRTTTVYIEHLSMPLTASRSEGAMRSSKRKRITPSPGSGPWRTLPGSQRDRGVILRTPLSMTASWQQPQATAGAFLRRP